MFIFKTIIWGTMFSFITLIAGPWMAVHFDSSFPPINIGNIKYIGIAIMAFAIPFAIYCTAILVIPSSVRPAPYDANGSFAIEGPYKYVRNPFLLSIIISLIGEAILMSRVIMIGYTIIFICCIHFWVVFFEEPTLEERFRNEYKKYKESVPRWIPKRPFPKY